MRNHANYFNKVFRSDYYSYLLLYMYIDLRRMNKIPISAVLSVGECTLARQKEDSAAWRNQPS